MPWIFEQVKRVRVLGESRWIAENRNEHDAKKTERREFWGWLTAKAARRERREVTAKVPRDDER